MNKIIKGICHSCKFRHTCCPHCPPKEEYCRHWKLGKCYTCKFIDDMDNNENTWFKRGCETWCFGGCRKYRRSWKKTFEILKNKFNKQLFEIEKREQIIEYLLNSIEEEHIGMRSEMIKQIKDIFNFDI